MAKLPWKRTAESRAQAEEARQEFESTVAAGRVVRSTVAALFAHADVNNFTEKIERVARGR